MSGHAVMLTDICNIQYGFAFDSKQFSASGKTPLVRIRDVVRGFSETYTNEDFTSNYQVHDGDILVGMDGEFNVARWHGGEAALNQRVCKLIPSDKIDGQYLFYSMIRKLKRIEERTAFVTVKHLSAKELNKISLTLPTLQVQKNIAEKLDTISRIISYKEKSIHLLDALIKSRFIEMFGDISLTSTMQEACKFITDGTHQPPKFVNEGIPFIFVSNIANDRLTYNAEKFISEETYNELVKRTPIEIGDVLLSTVGSYGHPAIVESNRKFLFQRHIAYLKPDKDKINSRFLHAVILSDVVKRQIDSKVKGIAQKTLNLSEIKSLQIPLPPLNLQKQFADFVSLTDKSKLAAQKSIEVLQTMKASLMQEYFG